MMIQVVVVNLKMEEITVRKITMKVAAALISRTGASPQLVRHAILKIEDRRLPPSAFLPGSENGVKSRVPQRVTHAPTVAVGTTALPSGVILATRLEILNNCHCPPTTSWAQRSSQTLLMWLTSLASLERLVTVEKSPQKGRAHL